MLRISTRPRYALRLMVDVARHGGDGAPVSLSSVSKRTKISKGYLEQLVPSLRSAGLLRAVFGRYGGYQLAEPASEITIGRIFDALIGPTCFVDCVDDPASCPRSGYCECRVIYRMMNERVLEVLQSATLANLLDSEWARSHGAGPNPARVGAAEAERGACRPRVDGERTGGPCR